MIINPYNFAPALPPESGLVAFYKGEDNALDSSGNNHHGGENSSTTYTDGFEGRAFLHSGAGDNTSISLPDITEITGDYSIECYIYSILNQNYGHLVSRGYTSSAYGAWYLNNRNLEYWQNSVLRVATTGSTITENSWFKINLTYDGSKTRIYINNVLAATESGTHTETGFGSVKIGYARFNSDATFQGRMDEVKFYNGLV